MSELKILRAELSALQATLESIIDIDELKAANEQCGDLRRVIRNKQQENQRVREAMRSRFTERGRT